MIKQKISELSGPALDWAVAVAQGIIQIQDPYSWVDSEELKFSSDWFLGGPIIEQEKIGLCYQGTSGLEWAADIGHGLCIGYGPTPLVAAMRCYVASKLGEYIDVPDELI